MVQMVLQKYGKKIDSKVNENYYLQSIIKGIKKWNNRRLSKILPNILNDQIQSVPKIRNNIKHEKHVTKLEHLLIIKPKGKDSDTFTIKSWASLVKNSLSNKLNNVPVKKQLFQTDIIEI